MDEKERTRRSKFLSLVLRHQPEVIGVALDAAGWIEVDTLLEALAAAGRPLDRADLDELVATSPKQRFAFSEDRQRIRASQGHSIEVELGYEAAEPPATLFHGTFPGALDAIRAGGLSRMARHHVHLSADRTTAVQVGGRRGQPVILIVDAAAMRRAGHLFYRAANGVWLTESVPPGFLRFPDE